MSYFNLLLISIIFSGTGLALADSNISGDPSLTQDLYVTCDSTVGQDLDGDNPMNPPKIEIYVGKDRALAEKARQLLRCSSVHGPAGDRATSCLSCEKPEPSIYARFHQGQVGDKEILIFLASKNDERERDFLTNRANSLAGSSAPVRAPVPVRRGSR